MQAKSSVSNQRCRRRPAWTPLSRSRSVNLWKPITDNLREDKTIALGAYQARTFHATLEQKSHVEHFQRTGWNSDNKRILRNTQALTEKKRIPNKNSNSFKKIRKQTELLLTTKRGCKRKREEGSNDDNFFLPEHKICLDSSADELEQMIQEHQSKLEEKERDEIEAEAIIVAKTVQRKTRCVRMYPDASHRKVLDGWFTDAQKVWNQALNMIYRAEYHIIRKDISFVAKQKQENEDAPNPQPLSIVRFLNVRRNPRKKKTKRHLQRIRTVQSRMNVERAERFASLREKDTQRWREQNERTSRDWDAKVEYSSALQLAATWDILRKRFTSEAALLSNQHPTRKMVKSHHQIFPPPAFEPSKRTPVGIAQNALKALAESWKSGITKIIRKQQFYFRVKPKENHFQTTKCNSDTISISSRSTKLFTHEEGSFQLKPPSQCKEYKSYLRRFNKTLPLPQQQAFFNFCEWKKKKLFTKYELQDSKSHKMITSHSSIPTIHSDSYSCSSISKQRIAI